MPRQWTRRTTGKKDGMYPCDGPILTRANQDRSPISTMPMCSRKVGSLTVGTVTTTVKLQKVALPVTNSIYILMLPLVVWPVETPKRYKTLSTRSSPMNRDPVIPHGSTKLLVSPVMDSLIRRIWISNGTQRVFLMESTRFMHRATMMKVNLAPLKRSMYKSTHPRKPSLPSIMMTTCVWRISQVIPLHQWQKS